MSLLSQPKKVIRRLVNACGYDIHPYVPTPSTPPKRKYPVHFTERDIATVETVQPFTMTGPTRILAMIRAAEHVVQHGIPGAVVECGVWRGGSLMAAARTLQNLSAADRELYLFDTFEGMSAPTEEDMHERGEHARGKFEATKTDAGSKWCYASLEDVQANVGSLGYDPGLVHFVKGKVEETIPPMAQKIGQRGGLPSRIAILRLDTDWYESTRIELQHLYPLLVPGGLLVIDDYFDWKGQKKAVDEYFAQQGIPIFLHCIDHSARIAVKP